MGDVIIFVIIYVDNIIVASSSHDAVLALLQDLNKNFAIKDLGDLHYFLGIEVSKVQDGILLTQEKYASDLLKRVGMENCKPVNTPLSPSEKLSAYDERVDVFGCKRCTFSVHACVLIYNARKHP